MGPAPSLLPSRSGLSYSLLGPERLRRRLTPPPPPLPPLSPPPYRRHVCTTLRKVYIFVSFSQKLSNMAALLMFRRPLQRCVFRHQGPVFQTLDSTIQRESIRESNCVIHWIEIYRADSVIHLLNNWTQEFHNEPSEFKTYIYAYIYILYLCSKFTE